MLPQLKLHQTNNQNKDQFKNSKNNGKNRENDDSNDNMSVPSIQLHSIRQPSIPPIFVNTMPNHSWRVLAYELRKHKDVEHLTAKITLTPSQIQINFPDENSFRLVQKFLIINSSIVNFHFFTLASEKALKILIKVPLLT